MSSKKAQNGQGKIKKGGATTEELPVCVFKNKIGKYRRMYFQNLF